MGLSLLVSGTLLVLNDSPSGDLSRWYTDHLHHVHATWVMLHKGLAIYTQPFGEALKGVDYPHPMPSWLQMPGMVYPPGVFAVFLPVTLVGRFIPLSHHAFAVLCVLWTLVLAHLALAAVLRAMEATRGAGELTLAVIAWLYLVHMGMQGFYDGAWVGCGAMMVATLARRRPVSTLRWFALAALLHFRAAVLVPLAAAALWEVLRGRPWRQWPWRDLALVGVAVALCLGSFALMYPVTSAFRGSQPSLLQLHAGGRLWIIVVVSVVAVAVSAWLADAVVAATVAAGALLGLAYVNFWWHGAVLLFAPLAVGAFRTARHAPAVRAMLIGWMLCVQPLAWRDHAAQFWFALAEGFQPRR
ncbi:hypothetical protein P2318_10145 [Myxococcaceae bacterium GXIMD 01537]